MRDARCAVTRSGISVPARRDSAMDPAVAPNPCRPHLSANGYNSTPETIDADRDGTSPRDLGVDRARTSA